MKTFNYGFYVLNEGVTRRSKSKGSFLDIVVTNINLSTRTSVVDTDLSDHYAVCVNLLYDCSGKDCTDRKNDEYWTDYNKVIDCLKNTNFDFVLQYTDLDQAFQSLINEIKRTIKVFTVLKGKHRYKESKEGWMTKSLLKALRKKK